MSMSICFGYGLSVCVRNALHLRHREFGSEDRWIVGVRDGLY